MGCGGSKLDLSEAQSTSEFLVEEMGRVSGQMDVTCSSEIKFERMKPSVKPILLMDASLGKDADAFASVEKDSNGPTYNFICKDAKGTLVALMCITVRWTRSQSNHPSAACSVRTCTAAHLVVLLDAI